MFKRNINVPNLRSFQEAVSFFFSRKAFEFGYSSIILHVPRLRESILNTNAIQADFSYDMNINDYSHPVFSLCLVSC